MSQTVKHVINPDYGRGLAALDGPDGSGELVHSQGVHLELPGHDWILVSGIVAFDEDLEVVAPGDIAAQTRHVLGQLTALLEARQATIDDVVRVRVYVVDLTDEALRAVHAERRKVFHRDHYPASTLVEVKGLIAPGLRIEIDADAVVLRDREAPRNGGSP